MIPDFTPAARSPAASSCEPFRDFIEEGLRRGRNAKAIYQDLVVQHGFSARYASVSRFARKLRGTSAPEAHAVIVSAIGEEAQVDYGDGAMVRNPETGKYRRTRLTESIARDMVQVRLTNPFRFVVVGAPAHLSRHGTPERPDDLLRHECIGLRESAGTHYAWEFERGRRAWRVPVRASVITNDAGLNASLAAQGLGLTYALEPMVSEAQHSITCSSCRRRHRAGR